MYIKVVKPRPHNGMDGVLNDAKVRLSVTSTDTVDLYLQDRPQRHAAISAFALLSLATSRVGGGHVLRGLLNPQACNNPLLGTATAT